MQRRRPVESVCVCEFDFWDDLLSHREICKMCPQYTKQATEGAVGRRLCCTQESFSDPTPKTKSLMLTAKQGGNRKPFLCYLAWPQDWFNAQNPSVTMDTELCVSILTTTPNCSGSDKFAYSFSYLAKALSCSCSGRCFTRFYKEVRWKVVRSSMEKANDIKL